MRKKARRLADKAWRDRQTLPLGLELQEFADSLDDSEEDPASEKEIKISLGIGRPRMKSETVFLFMLFRGYFDSVTDVRTTDRIIDSITIRCFFQNHGFGNLPKRSIIHDNIQAVSYETRNYIYRTQLADVKDQGIDDYKRLTLDSTAVMANSKWPVDSGVICRLLDRAFRNSQSLSKYGVSNFMPWHTVFWLSKISCLNFRINVTSGRGARVKRRGFYRTLYTEAEKIMSLSDGSAAFIVKGDRETVLGYRPQVGRSGKGFITVLYVPEGNAADSPQLVSLVEEAISNTGVVSNIVSVDDGYSSAQGIGSVRMIPGVDVVSASGSKAERLFPQKTGTVNHTETPGETVHRLNL